MERIETRQKKPHTLRQGPLRRSRNGPRRQAAWENRVCGRELGLAEASLTLCRKGRLSRDSNFFAALRTRAGPSDVQLAALVGCLSQTALADPFSTEKCHTPTTRRCCATTTLAVILPIRMLRTGQIDKFQNETVRMARDFELKGGVFLSYLSRLDLHPFLSSLLSSGSSSTGWWEDISL